MLAKYKFNSIEALVSKDLIALNISHDKFVLLNNELKDFYDMKKKLKVLIIDKSFICISNNVILLLRM